MVNPRNVNCKVGFLGKTCSIKCEDVLGEKYNYCENHKIWYNNIYECPWGYSGDSCDKGGYNFLYTRSNDFEINRVNQNLCHI